MFYFFCFFSYIHFSLSPLSLFFISSTISSISLLPFSGRSHKMTHKGGRVVKPQHNPILRGLLPYLFYIFRQTALSKQCRPRFDAAECGVWSGFTLLATNQAILHTFTGSKMGLLKRRIRKSVPNLSWKWNFESKKGSAEPSNPLWICPCIRKGS